MKQDSQIWKSRKEQENFGRATIDIAHCQDLDSISRQGTSVGGQWASDLKADSLYHRPPENLGS